MIIDTTQMYFGNTLKEYIIAFSFFVLLFGLLYLFKYVMLFQIKKITKKTKNSIDDMVIDILESISWPFYAYIAFYLSVIRLDVPRWLNNTFDFILLAIGAFYVVRAGSTFIDVGKKYLAKKREDDSVILSVFAQMLKGVLWAVAILFFLQNIGIDITALLAGAGVAGIAIAFALQAILEDIFSSLSIYLDKPFQVKDFIIIGTDMGVIEKIGIKTTRIRTLQGQQLIVSNKELTSVRVNNYGRMQERRVVFNFGVTYDTGLDKLKKIPNIIKNIAKDNKKVRLDRVHFKSYGESSLDHEVVYYVDTADYNTYMDVQQQFNLKLYEKFDKEKIEFAFPTRTIHLQKE